MVQVFWTFCVNGNSPIGRFQTKLKKIEATSFFFLHFYAQSYPPYFHPTRPSERIATPLSETRHTLCEKNLPGAVWGQGWLRRGWWPAAACPACPGWPLWIAFIRFCVVIGCFHIRPFHDQWFHNARRARQYGTASSKTTNYTWKIGHHQQDRLKVAKVVTGQRLPGSEYAFFWSDFT